MTTPNTPYLVLLDMDSTFIQNEVIDLLADIAGVGAEVAAVTESAMRGELDFKVSLATRTALLKGLPEESFEEARERITLSTGAQELVDTLHIHGSKIGIVSGGFTNIIAPILTSVGVDFFKANTLEVQDGKLTGRVLGEIVDKSVKAQYLTEKAEEYQIPLSRCIAVGDGANDLEMMALAGKSVAFNAKPIVQEQASHAINDGDLRGILRFINL